MDTTRQLRLEPQVGAARTARAFVGRVLADWRLSDHGQKIILVSHELVANALVHAGSPVVLRLARHDGRLTVQVVDADQRTPRAPESDDADTRTSGRGLMIVESLANRWGVRTMACGKVVWAELDCDDDADQAVDAEQPAADQPDAEPADRAGPAASPAGPGGISRGPRS